MAETIKVEDEEIEPISLEKGKTKRKAKKDVDRNKRLKGIILSVTKPSYNLQRGRGTSFTEFESLRWLNRNRLNGLLRKLMRRHNWEEASGVLSLLLKGTCKEKSATKNRTKYLATMELLKHADYDSIGRKKFQHVFETWMKKIGGTRGCQTKDRFAVQLEFIVFCLTHGNVEDAHQAVIWLMQEGEFGSNPFSYLVVGLAYCQDWYDAIRKEFPAIDLNEFHTPNQAEILVSGFDMSIEDPEVHVADEFQEANYTVRCTSNSSVRNDKEVGSDDENLHQVSLEREAPHKIHGPQSFYVHSAESDGHEEPSFSGHASIFYAQGLETWLLPSRLLNPIRSVDEFMYLQNKVHNDSYRGALKYLRLALTSTPPMLEALLPLVQMLLLGDQVQEAIDEVENFASSSDTALLLRLKASLLEHFGSNNHEYLSTCFEDALKKDPTCTHSLMRLLCMHRNGGYSAVKLLEMIALHLDATYADCSIWKEFASCLLKLSMSEEDRMSTCLNGNGSISDFVVQGNSNNSNRKPSIFADGGASKDWILRCKWWMTRHFSHNMFVSEVEAGDMQLLTYKAASACHLYGRDFEYVGKVSNLVYEDTNSDLFSFLHMHLQNSVGFFKRDKKTLNGILAAHF